MSDTLPEIERVYREMLMARSGKERFTMGLEMFEMATVMMLAGLGKSGDDSDRQRIFQRLYGDEFTIEEQTQIFRKMLFSGR